MPERPENLNIWQDGIDAEILSIRSELRANTEMTRGLQKKMDTISTQVKPVLDAMETMEAGIRMMGRIGHFGERFGHIMLVLIGLGVVAKILLSGGSWSSAAQAFSRFIGR